MGTKIMKTYDETIGPSLNLKHETKEPREEHKG
jgi:hypothetical protein